jgi:hypothetical protein
LALVLGGLALVAMIAATAVAMSRAERRARRKLFQTLDLSDETVELLMARNRNVLAELALVRVAALSPEQEGRSMLEAGAHEIPPQRALPVIRLVHPAAEDPPGDATRRQPFSGSRRRF